MHQVFGNAAPLLQQPGVDVLLVLNVGTARTEEGLEGVGAQFSRLVVVLTAVAKNGTEPLVVDESALPGPPP